MKQFLSLALLGVLALAGCEASARVDADLDDDRTSYRKTTVRTDGPDTYRKTTVRTEPDGDRRIETKTYVNP